MRTAILTIISLFVVLFTQTCFAASIPQIASAMGRELDRQVVEHTGQGDSPAQGLSLFMTTPADSNDLSRSNPLARQMQEELMRWFVQAGYPVQEIRKGADVLFDEAEGELILSRRSDLLSSDTIGSGALVAGTYTVTPKSVRFNIRLIQTGSSQVLAMSTITVPITDEIAALLQSANTSGEFSGRTAIQPSVLTQLP